MVKSDYFSNADASANANNHTQVLLNLFLSSISINHHPHFSFLVGLVGAVTHPLPGVPLTFLFAFHKEIHGKL